MNNPMQKITDFIAGQKDCRDGDPHQQGQSEDYDKGYAFQYEIEQISGERSR